MNRQLKFRIWDSRLNKFDYFDIFTSFGHIPADCKENIQQFTGLLDKHGKEIYEGDIVSNITKSHKKGVIGEIKLGDGLDSDGYEVYGYHISTKEEKFFIGSDDIKKVYSIVGNIYENPELLENDKTK